MGGQRAKGSEESKRLHFFGARSLVHSLLSRNGKQELTTFF
jgi:hypothetical protein